MMVYQKISKNIKKITAVILFCSPFLANAQFKVVGYIRSKSNIVSDLKKIDLNKLTHLNIAFINPDTLGEFKDMPEIDSVVMLAHKAKVKVLMSCGGGSRQAYYAKLLSDDKRKRVVRNFVAFVNQYRLDGIDVDIEGDDIDDNYEKFILDLKPQLVKRKKLLTAALAYYTRNKITDKALQQFDFINVMAYDKTGPWRPSNPGQHSPLSYATDHLTYWTKGRAESNLPASKIVLGVPFYGYGFGTTPLADRTYQEMSWSSILKNFPDSMNVDEVLLPNGGGTVYYNGKATIKAKTELALKEAGGIMIWQLMHDSFDENALLNVIDATVKQAENKTK
jgi:chitinase